MSDEKIDDLKRQILGLASSRVEVGESIPDDERQEARRLAAHYGGQILLALYESTESTTRAAELARNLRLVAHASDEPAGYELELYAPSEVLERLAEVDELEEYDEIELDPKSPGG